MEHDEYEMQIETTLSTLRDMQFSAPYLIVMNKSEGIADTSIFPYGSIAISAKENLGIDSLKRAILNKFREEYLFCKLFIPYTKTNEYATIRRLITERRIIYHEDGQEIDAIIPAKYTEKFSDFIVEYRQ